MQTKSSRRPLHVMTLTAGALSMALAVGSISTAEASRYGRGDGGAGSARYDKYLEAEAAKRGKAAATKAQSSQELYQQAGEVPTLTGQSFDKGAKQPPSRRELHHRSLNQHLRGR